MPAHPNCRGPEGHVCQVPSGRPCYETGCEKEAGTLWGPHWCPDHDMERIERISAQMKDLQRAAGELINHEQGQAAEG